MPPLTTVRPHEVPGLSCSSEAECCLQGKAGACMMIWFWPPAKLRKASGGRVQKVMIIDLDVHQVTFAPTATPHSRCSCCCPAAECLRCSVSTYDAAACCTAQ